jgi:hypothetical protein
MQRTASKAATDVQSVCRPRFACVAHSSGLAVADLVSHRGAKVKFVGDSRYVKDASGILKWIANDRCTAKFVSKKDVESKAAALAAVVTEWVENLSNEEK